MLATPQMRIRATLRERENLGQAPEIVFAMEFPFATDFETRYRICGEELSEDHSNEG
jgi:hypothetical protein